jgi:hypothetical protein
MRSNAYPLDPTSFMSRYHSRLYIYTPPSDSRLLPLDVSPRTGTQFILFVFSDAGEMSNCHLRFKDHRRYHCFIPKARSSQPRHTGHIFDQVRKSKISFPSYPSLSHLTLTARDLPGEGRGARSQPKTSAPNCRFCRGERARAVAAIGRPPQASDGRDRAG